MEIGHFHSLEKFSNLVHGISTADCGNMSFRYADKDTVKTNRKTFFDTLGIDQNHVAVTSLVHGNQILDISEKEWGRGIDEPATSLEGDILVTSKPDTYLFLVVADCLALFFYEPEKQVCALAHAGWRGVDLEVPKLTVEYLVKQKGCDPKKLVVGMSPALQKGEFDTPDKFENHANPKWEKYISKDGALHIIDWTKFAYDQLVEAGISPENIERSPIDTLSDKKFFSHRRSALEGEHEARFGCLIGFKN